MTEIFDQGFIQVTDAHQHNLKHINLKVPKQRITVFTGPSGSGKSSLAFDTIAAMSRRELNETFPSFTQQYLPKYGEPQVEKIEHLPVAIAIEQRPISGNERSTLSTYTGIYSLLRLLFSRIGQPKIGDSDNFSFNLPQGMCPRCQGLGYIDDIDETQLIDPNKSLNEGAIQFVGFGPDTWRWRRYVLSGLFDNDKPVKDYTPEEFDLLMHAPMQKLKNPPAEWYKTAKYEGVVPRIKRSVIYSKEGKRHKQEIERIVTRKACPLCHGQRLKAAALGVQIQGQNIADVSAMDLKHVLNFLQTIQEPLAREVVREMMTKIQSLVDIGLGYLTLNRSTGTLSGGEAQRIKIAKYLTSALSDMLYVLDEPSVGLHPHDIRLVKAALLKLKAGGNTILIVDHHPAMMALADYAVEVGPGSGAKGGKITFTGTYQELLASDTVTGHWLNKAHHFAQTRTPQKTLALEHAKLNNLADVSVDIPLGVMTVLSGVAGSGKSSLAKVIKANMASDYVDLTQRPVGINIRSTPVTYLNILDKIRQLFAKANGVSSQLFSYNGKGACPRCKGKGVTITNMAFMDAVVQTCELCHGDRYRQDVLAYHYHDKNIAQVLKLSVTEAASFFADVPSIQTKLANLETVGLGYISLNQTLTTLSGGELQRLNLALKLDGKGHTFFFDEPTAGLHMKDTANLLQLFKRLVDEGNSLIIIEHNLDVISQADWLIDMGPAAGQYGGQVMYSGQPAGSLDQPNSLTGQALKGYLERE
ncbi:ATP-binding cassette domain-containing protein [Weissella halotolerans]|uniref:UvrABC system protein A n=1 Tax=Weissella halotolerans DSM 20190 TaxID=1123500 RepID=A0A0R2G7P4_9LACO|nr:excinuclease ABC subunit UvrA [Weissella halotolerans]KRN33495.1 excinuclease ATPase subunit [Weissella halotolerans DSM 20190]